MGRIEGDGFALIVPDDWIVARNVMGATVAATAPRVDPTTFATNVNVVFAPTHEPLDDFVASYLDHQRSLLSDFHLLDDEVVAFAGTAGRRCLAAFVQGLYGLTIEQWIAVADGNAVILSGACESTAYDDASDAFRTVVSSFELTP